jgi:hypothetical protein
MFSMVWNVNPVSLERSRRVEGPRVRMVWRTNNWLWSRTHTRFDPVTRAFVVAPRRLVSGAVVANAPV